MSIHKLVIEYDTKRRIIPYDHIKFIDGAPLIHILAYYLRKCAERIYITDKDGMPIKGSISRVTPKHNSTFWRARSDGGIGQ